MDLEKGWHDTGATLAKLLLATFAAAAGIAAGIFAVGRPSLDDIAMAEERILRISVAAEFVRAFIPTDVNIPIPRENSPIVSWDYDEAVVLFAGLPKVGDTLKTILDRMLPVAQQASADENKHTFFRRYCPDHTFQNFSLSGEVENFPAALVRTTQNVFSIERDLRARGVLGKAANDLTLEQLALVNTLLGERSRTIASLAWVITEDRSDQWFCSLAIPPIFNASAWDMERMGNDRLGSGFAWALDSDDHEIVALRGARPSEVPAIQLRFERDRKAQVQAYLADPSLRVTTYLPPLGFKLGVALFPLICVFTLLTAMSQVMVLLKNMRLPNTTFSSSPWQQRLSGYLVFPIPKRAGGSLIEVCLSSVCWFLPLVLCFVLRGFVDERYDRTMLHLNIPEDWDWQRGYVQLSEVIEKSIGGVPSSFPHQPLFAFCLWGLTASVAALLILTRRARRRANELAFRA